MTLSELSNAFRKEVSKPTVIQGDSWGIDATTEDIVRLMNTPPDDLTAEDFNGYLGYCTTGGDDDLRYLLPPILRIWEKELYSKDGWFTQYFHAELCRTDFLERALSEPLKAATTAFMIRALSDRLSSESSLSVTGRTTSHDWPGFLASFGVYSTKISAIWNHLWESADRGHAIAILQYLSCLIYNDDNPVFAPWTCDKGGGAPALWGYDSVGFDERWKDANLEYLSSALNSTTITQWLEHAAKRFHGQPIGNLAENFTMRLKQDPSKVEDRCVALTHALWAPSGVGIVTWQSLLDA